MVSPPQNLGAEVDQRASTQALNKVGDRAFRVLDCLFGLLLSNGVTVSKPLCKPNQARRNTLIIKLAKSITTDLMQS